MQYSNQLCGYIYIYIHTCLYTHLYTYSYMYVREYILIQVNAIRIISYMISFVHIYIYLYPHFPSLNNAEL